MVGWEGALTGAFIGVLNMSLTACVMVLAVLVIRALLCRRARIFSYLLWAVVLFRLLCPVSIPGPGSLLGMLQSGTNVHGRMEYVTEELGFQAQPEVKLSRLGGGDGIRVKLPEATPETSVHPVQVGLFAGSVIWVLGMAGMGCYTAVSWGKLHRRLRNGRRERGRIYRLPGAGTPFVYGVFRTKIFLPEELEAEEEAFVLRHEEIHVQRRDPLWRMLAWLALCIHWFNPLVWLAYGLSEKDMEMSCDEAVIRELGPGVKKAYTTSLLSMAAGRSRLARTPIAFGEQDTGSRIRHVLRYKKPGKWMTVLLTFLCAVLAGWMLVNPGSSAAGEDTASGTVDDGQGNSRAVDGQGDSGVSDGAAVTEAAAMDTGSYAEMAEATLTDGQVPDGNYAVRALSIDWTEKAVDRYLIEDIEEADHYPALPFSEDCTYKGNISMNRVEIREFSYDAFERMIRENGIDNYVVLYCVIKDGQIRQIYMPGSYYGYGIAYAAPSDWDEFTWQQEAVGMDGEELLETYYSLDNTETADVSDAPGTEQIQVYTGNVGDGQSGYVLIRDAEGSLLHAEWAHESRAGWNNIYLGEQDGASYLMTLHVENWEEYGSYGYQVYRLAADGTVRQIAGSTLDWNAGVTRYREDLFRQWADQMSAYLENSHLLLSTQDGILRTEKVNEADWYDFDAWKGYGNDCRQ